LRGNVFIYQGEELGLSQAQIPFEKLRDPEAIANWPLTLGRDGARTPMPWNNWQPNGGFSEAEPWLPVPQDHIERAVSVQNADPDSVLAAARQLIALRRDAPALRLGDFVPLSLKAPLLGFERVLGKERVHCLFNLGDAPIKIAREKGRVLFAHGVHQNRLESLGVRISAFN
jgi:alpha-glucosidase